MGIPIEASAVRRFPPFEGLSDSEVAVAAGALGKVTLAPGQALFRQGDWGSSAYLVVTGRVDIRTAGHDGDHELVRLEAGAALGQLGLLLDQCRSASVVARGHVELWEITRQAFQTGLDHGDVWATRFLFAAAKALAERLGAVSERLVALLEEAGGSNREPPATRVAELEELRRRLSREWSF